MTKLLALAVIPGIVILFYVNSKDKVEHEPFKLLLKIFLFGLLSFIPALILELLGDKLLYEMFGDSESVLAVLVENFIFVGLIEEACKYKLCKMASWKSKEFDYRFDGIVYALFASMGFAIIENIFYVVQNGFANGIVRALVSLPGHASFGIVMGIYYGQAKLCEYQNDKAGKKSNLFKAVMIPMLLHGFFDFALSIGSVAMVLVFLVYIVAMDIVIMKKINKYSKEDVKIAPDFEKDEWLSISKEELEKEEI